MWPRGFITRVESLTPQSSSCLTRPSKLLLPIFFFAVQPRSSHGLFSPHIQWMEEARILSRDSTSVQATPTKVSEEIFFKRSLFLGVVRPHLVILQAWNHTAYLQPNFVGLASAHTWSCPNRNTYLMCSIRPDSQDISMAHLGNVLLSL